MALFNWAMEITNTKSFYCNLYFGRFWYGFVQMMMIKCCFERQLLSKTENKYKKHNQYLKMKWYIYMKISQCFKVKIRNLVNLLESKSWIEFLNLLFVKVNWLIEMNFELKIVKVYWLIEIEIGPNGVLRESNFGFSGKVNWLIASETWWNGGL